MVIEEQKEYIDTVLAGRKRKRERSPVTGFYLDDDVRNILQKLGEKGGRGARSRVANDAFRKYFKEKGLL